MTTLTFNDFYSNMGLVDRPLMNVNPAWTWTTKAWISMGTRMHGDGLAAGWVAGIPGAAGTPSDPTTNPNYTALTTQPWNDVVGWVYFQPSAENTCTNAAVLVYDFQTLFFNLTTNRWEFTNSDAYNYRNAVFLGYYITNTLSYDGSADKIYTGRNNIPRTSNVKLSADRSSASSDTSKYRIVHNGVNRATLDYTKVGGITVMCRARIEPISGSLNGVPSIMLQVGADYYPEVGVGLNSGLLTGIYSAPAVGASQFRKLELYDQTFLFTTAKINTDTLIITDSQYVQSFPAGTYPNCMSAATFTANVPQFISF